MPLVFWNNTHLLTNQTKLPALTRFLGLEAGISQPLSWCWFLMQEMGCMHSRIMLNRLLICVHKVKNRCVTSGLSAWSYINFAEILLVTKVYLLLAEPKAQSRKWEGLFLVIGPCGWYCFTPSTRQPARFLCTRHECAFSGSLYCSCPERTS